MLNMSNLLRINLKTHRSWRYLPDWGRGGGTWETWAWGRMRGVGGERAGKWVPARCARYQLLPILCPIPRSENFIRFKVSLVKLMNQSQRSKSLKWLKYDFKLLSSGIYDSIPRYERLFFLVKLMYQISRSAGEN